MLSFRKFLPGAALHDFEATPANPDGITDSESHGSRFAELPRLFSSQLRVGFFARPRFVLLWPVSMGVRCSHSVGAVFAGCWDGAAERLVSPEMAEVASSAGTDSGGECAGLYDSERPMDGVLCRERSGRRNGLRGIGSCDGVHCGNGVADCNEAAVR